MEKKHNLVYLGHDCYQCDDCGAGLTRQEVQAGATDCLALTPDDLVTQVKALGIRIDELAETIAALQPKEGEI